MSNGTYYRNTRADGTQTTHGGTKLKESQHYPEDFGRAVATMFREVDSTRVDVAGLEHASPTFGGNGLDVFLWQGLGSWANESLGGVVRILRELAYR